MTTNTKPNRTAVCYTISVYVTCSLVPEGYDGEGEPEFTGKDICREIDAALRRSGLSRQCGVDMELMETEDVTE